MDVALLGTEGEFVVQHGGNLLERATAVFDPTHQYRYLLTRRWSDAAPLTMCMVNPSTADAFAVDPTVARCVRLARREGRGGLVIVNLFSLRATDPIGPATDAFLRASLGQAGEAVAAWGVHGELHGRAAAVVAELVEHGITLRCLGTTKHGQPRHPLYVKASTPLVAYRPQF